VITNVILKNLLIQAEKVLLSTKITLVDFAILLFLLKLRISFILNLDKEKFLQNIRKNTIFNIIALTKSRETCIRVASYIEA